MKILCFGDSITYGESDPVHGGWADRIKRDFQLQFENATRQKIVLYNLGVGGETSDGLVKRFKAELTARRIKGQPAFVLFSYGANDIVIHKKTNIVPLKYFLANIASCIDICVDNDISYALLGLLPIDEKIDGVLNQHDKLRFKKDIALYDTALGRLAIEKGCPFVNLLGLFDKELGQQLLTDDGLHPNTLGHELIYKQVKRQLNPLWRV